MEGEARYWAFLSYSHHDRHLAERLHRALEIYRLPRRLIGRQGPMGTVPERLHPNFRDRDEFTTSSQIGPAVQAALSASRALVVRGEPGVGKSALLEYVVERASGEIDREAAKFLPSLGPGQAVVIGVELPMPLTVQMLRPSNPPDSRGPDYQSCWR